MAHTKGLQGFLEQRAEGPAFLIVFMCMIARASQFYSGGALSLRSLLGQGGMQVFDALTGVGLAVGCELLFAIAGRTWQANKRDARDAMARKGMSKAEKQALRDYYLSKARIAFLFMLIGLGASLAAAISFLWGASGDHSVGAAIGECVVALLLVAVVGFLAIFKESSGGDPDAESQAIARSGRASIVGEAGKRIAAGNYTARDVRIVARQLPKAERDKFEAALMPEDADDPQWTARDILSWLADDSAATKRRIQRRLSKLYDSGAGAVRDDSTGQYRIPRSIVLQQFAEEFLNAHAPARVQAAVKNYAGPPSQPRQTPPADAQEPPSDSDADATAAQERPHRDNEEEALVTTAAATIGQ